MSTKIVYISSLAFSGSTLLDLVLGGHPNIVGFGEISKVHDQNKQSFGNSFYNPLCSCGQKAYDCEFWPPILEHLRKKPNISKTEYYQLVIKTFRSFYGDNAILVDSSKYDPALNLIRNLENVNLSVLRIIKDVRGFTISHLDHSDLRAKPTNILTTLHHLALKSPTYLFWKWYIRNKKIKTDLTDGQINYFQVGYEELCLRQELIIDKICEFLEIEPVSEMLVPENSGSHALTGNAMRVIPQKKRGVVYDNRWFFRKEWVLPSLLFPHIMRYNSKEVYPNTFPF